MIFPKNSKKTYEIEKILGRREGARRECLPLDPPLPHCTGPPSPTDPSDTGYHSRG